MELYEEDVFDDQGDDIEDPDMTGDQDTRMDVVDENDGDEGDDSDGEDDVMDDNGSDEDEDQSQQVVEESDGGAHDESKSAQETVKSSPKRQDDSKVIPGTYKQRFPLSFDSSVQDAQAYEIVPTTAFLHGGAVYSMCLSWGAKYLFTGGEDGYIRRYNFVDSMSGKQLLSMGQRPASVDTIVKAGVISSYWENEQPLFESEYKFESDDTYTPKLSPVYSLAVQSECLWLCSGLEGGGITMQTIRYGEGIIQAYLEGHSSTVSDLVLDGPETHLLSGSWDKTVVYWDLNTSKKVHTYNGLNGQISSIAWQPIGGPGISSDDDNKSMGSLFGSDEEEQKEEQKTEDTKNTGTVFLSSTMNGVVEIWDTRSPAKVMSLSNHQAPPWCLSACWSVDGSSVYAGRRNSSVDEFDIRAASTPSRTLKFPSISGSVTCVTAMPNGRHLMCGSLDNLRLYDLQAHESKKTPFYIVPGYHGAIISRMVLDPSGRYFLTASGGRGWEEGSSDVVLGYEIGAESD